MLHLIALILQNYCKNGNKNTIIMINKHIMWVECIYYHALSRGYHPRTVRREMYLLKVEIYHYMWHVVILLYYPTLMMGKYLHVMILKRNFVTGVFWSRIMGPFLEA